jgi:oligopeptide/dipeptide ABC transporter ATP-binding protein
MGLTYIFISHDLSVIEHICDRTAIMYLGQLAELGETGEIFDNPRHPYTKALLSAIPKVDDMRQGERILLKGDIPNPSNPPEGCRFRTRCNYAADVCRTKPEAYEIMEGHIVACHLISKDGGLASVVSGQ